MARFFLTTYALVLGLTAGWAGAEQEKPTGESPPVGTLLGLITGTCHEIQRYAESVVGSGVIRSAAEVGNREEIHHRLIAYCFSSCTRK